MEAYMINDSTVTVFYGTGIYTADTSAVDAEQIEALLEEGEYEIAIDLMDTATAIAKSSDGMITIDEGMVLVNGVEVENSITRRILQLHYDGKNFDRIGKFLVRVEKNPSSKSRRDLYRFMEAHNMPIAANGKGYALKNVDENYYDKHSHSFRNRVGDVVKMDRRDVDDDSSNTCSSGLHLCSMEYLKGFWGTGGHTMVCEFDPEHVVSVPEDYNGAKMRVCEYTVVAEHSGNTEDLIEDQDYDEFESAYNYAEF